MATVEICLKDPIQWTAIETEDILTVRSKNLAHLIIDSPKATIRLRFSAEEAARVATKLMLPPNL
jgi:hypothetical protein